MLLGGLVRTVFFQLSYKPKTVQLLTQTWRNAVLHYASILLNLLARVLLEGLRLLISLHFLVLRMLKRHSIVFWTSGCLFSVVVRLLKLLFFLLLLVRQKKEAFSCGMSSCIQKRAIARTRYGKKKCVFTDQ